MHGNGTYTWSYDDVYEGQWKNDVMHGQGRYTHATNGSVSSESSKMARNIMGSGNGRMAVDMKGGSMTASGMGKAPTRNQTVTRMWATSTMESKPALPLSLIQTAESLLAQLEPVSPEKVHTPGLGQKEFLKYLMQKGGRNNG